MVIYIDESVADNVAELSTEDKICLEYIAESVRLGKHIVLGSSRTLNILFHIEDLNARTKSIYRKIYSNRTQIGQIFQHINLYIRVMYGINYFEKNTDNNHDQINVPLSFFNNTSKVEICYLLCEDLKDCKFYINLTNYIKKEIVNNFMFNLIPSNGGGSNSADNYQNIIKNNFPCISIVDSDKDSKMAKIQETATKLKNKYRAYSNNHLTNIHILKVREKENLITPHIYLILSDEPSDYKVLKQIYENPNYRDICYYGDIKSGLRITDENLMDYLIKEIDFLVESKMANEELLRKVSLCLSSSGLDTSLSKAVDSYISKNSNIEKKENDEILICGVRKLFEKFNKEILEGGLDVDITKAKSEYEDKPHIDFFEKQVKLLNIKKEQIVNSVDNPPEEYKNWWDEISTMCFSWGCAMKIDAVC